MRRRERRWARGSAVEDAGVTATPRALEEFSSGVGVGGAARQTSNNEIQCPAGAARLLDNDPTAPCSRQHRAGVAALSSDAVLGGTGVQLGLCWAGSSSLVTMAHRRRSPQGQLAVKEAQEGLVNGSHARQGPPTLAWPPAPSAPSSHPLPIPRLRLPSPISLPFFKPSAALPAAVFLGAALIPRCRRPSSPDSARPCLHILSAQHPVQHSTLTAALKRSH